MADKKSWKYQKDRYKQISVKFNMDDDYDRMLHYYLTCKVSNVSALIKKLVYEEMAGNAYGEE